MRRITQGLIGAFLALLLGVSPAASDAAADLALLKARAQAMPGGETLLATLQLFTSGPDADKEPFAVLLGAAAVALPSIPVMTWETLDHARARGKVVGRVLGADLNGDGEITQNELQTVASLRDINSEQQAETFDRNGDGTLDMTEIIAFADSTVAEETRKTGAAHTVRIMDLNTDGQVTPEERRRVLAALILPGK